MKCYKSKIPIIDLIMFKLWLRSAKKMIKWLVKSNQLATDIIGTNKERIKIATDHYCLSVKQCRKLEGCK